MWAIFYDDGSVVTDDFCEPEYLTKTGVIAIVHKTPEGIKIQRGRDYYWKTTDDDYGWYGGDLMGLWEQLTMSGSHIVLFGRSIPDRIFREVVQKATEYRFDA